MNTRLFAGVLGLVLLGLGATAMASERPADIRKQILRTRLEYSATYNGLNSDRRYDIVCPKVGYTRMCMPRYLDAARRKSLNKSCGVALTWGTADGDLGSYGYTGCDFWRDRAFIATANALDAAFRDNVQQAVARSSELQALRMKLDMLEARRKELTRS